MATDEIEIIRFNRQVSRDDFSCGNDELDKWLKLYAGQNEDKFRTRTFFAVEKSTQRLVGYYSAVFGVIEPELNLPVIANSKYARPAFVIARLAVDKKSQGVGIGKQLLSHALQSAIEASDSAGLEIIRVEAIDSDAVAFYGRFGFIRLDANSNRMFRTMKQLQQN